ncbi:hypothetical protein [Photobacterium damselae]|uniref:hypothetical protein n=1 Tax=Photobacterium damselae TaxID=38293 RepID=UPI00370BA93C
MFFTITPHDASLITKTISKTVDYIHFTTDGLCKIGTWKSCHTITTAQHIKKDIVITNCLDFSRKLKKAIALDKKANVSFLYKESATYGYASSLTMCSDSYKNSNPKVSFSVIASTTARYALDLPNADQSLVKIDVSQGILKLLDECTYVYLDAQEKTMKIYSDDAKIEYRYDGDWSGRVYLESVSLKDFKKAVHKDSTYTLEINLDADQKEAVIRIETDGHTFMISASTVYSKATLEALSQPVQKVPAKTEPVKPVENRVFVGSHYNAVLPPKGHSENSLESLGLLEPITVDLEAQAIAFEAARKANANHRIVYIEHGNSTGTQQDALGDDNDIQSEIDSDNELKSLGSDSGSNLIVKDAVQKAIHDSYGHVPF